ncbi:PREDICTED: uncharacterized protein LOC107069067 [Polistes dominula]|uniref:Uncharacterized protein LOC107069067 n=1 Tax=Polistes dominula TaxID=743375 RepID=A0ABM1IMS8_POLDO|nr:PREDICTED: uncharacterized protein LOC107069067 [Polistes dominula]
MDKIIGKVRELRGYKMGNKEVTILCYADDAVLIAENEDDLQRLLHQFTRTANTVNMKISAEKTKCMTTVKIPIRCKLEIEGKVIQQVMRFRYLGIEISGYGDIEEEVREQTTKAARVAGCLSDTIWRNKNIKIETKARIYKITIRPIMTYCAETRSDSAKTKRLLETTEMKILRKIARKTLLDKERSEKVEEHAKLRISTNGCWTEKKSGMHT